MEIAFDEFPPEALARAETQTLARRRSAPARPVHQPWRTPLFEDRAWIDELSAWADRLLAPRAILIVSAHWETALPSLSAASWQAGLRLRRSDRGTTGCATTPRMPPALVPRRRRSSLAGSLRTPARFPGGLDHGVGRRWKASARKFGRGNSVLQLSMPTADPGRTAARGLAAFVTSASTASL